MVGDRTEDFKAFSGGFERHREKILSMCRAPYSLDELARISPVYRNKMSDKILQETFEKGMILKSLDLMIQDGLIRRLGDKFIQNNDTK
jgi:hypothetical protein